MQDKIYGYLILGTGLFVAGLHYSGFYPIEQSSWGYTALWIFAIAASLAIRSRFLGAVYCFGVLPHPIGFLMATVHALIYIHGEVKNHGQT